MVSLQGLWGSGSDSVMRLSMGLPLGGDVPLVGRDAGSPDVLANHASVSGTAWLPE